MYWLTSWYYRKTREKYGEHLEGDMVVASVLDDLYTKMMEKNLLNIVLPYERLQVSPSVRVSAQLTMKQQK